MQHVIRFLTAALIAALALSLACSSETGEESTPAPTGTPAPTVTATPATPAVVLSVEAPGEVDAGGTFTARITVDEVSELAVLQFDLAYDPAVIEVAGEQGSASGVSNGAVSGSTISVAWAFVPPGEQGKVRVLGDTPGVTGVSGSGYVAEVHFVVLGTPDRSSGLSLTNVMLTDTDASELAPISVEHGSIAVVR